MNAPLIRIHDICISRNLPFVTFRLPRQDHSVTYIQTSGDDVNWSSIRGITSRKGFIMAPFDTRNGNRCLLIKPDLVIEGNSITRDHISSLSKVEAHEPAAWEKSLPVVTGREVYMDQVSSIKSSISKGAFQKAVLSRIRVIEGNHISMVPRIFRTICKKYPEAFVYLFKSGGQFWMGASPEPLLRRINGRISTVSLAGTMPYAEKYMDVNRWSVKEVLEQEYVTRYIHDVLRDFNIRDYRVGSPWVKRTGSLLHLCTDFSFDFDRIASRLWEFVDALHPTPAVAGQPKEDAIAFIRDLEPHRRDYYTGFLGPISRDGDIDLFVNLRCMKITPGYLSIYTGGGITLDSDPSAEWDETRWKAESLLKILRIYIKNLVPLYETQPTYR
jgi:isochorismate synthase